MKSVNIVEDYIILETTANNILKLIQVRLFYFIPLPFVKRLILTLS